LLFSQIERSEITGFVYCGHLFGEPVIPSGQRFKIKWSGRTAKFKQKTTWGILLEAEDGRGEWNGHDYNGIEPVFDL
jgi:hypothetical protein